MKICKCFILKSRSLGILIFNQESIEVLDSKFKIETCNFIFNELVEMDENLIGCQIDCKNYNCIRNECQCTNSDFLGRICDKKVNTLTKAGLNLQTKTMEKYDQIYIEIPFDLIGGQISINLEKPLLNLGYMINIQTEDNDKVNEKNRFILDTLKNQKNKIELTKDFLMRISKTYIIIINMNNFDIYPRLEIKCKHI